MTSRTFETRAPFATRRDPRAQVPPNQWICQQFITGFFAHRHSFRWADGLALAPRGAGHCAGAGPGPRGASPPPRVPSTTATFAPPRAHGVGAEAVLDENGGALLRRRDSAHRVGVPLVMPSNANATAVPTAGQSPHPHTPTAARTAWTKCGPRPKTSVKWVTYTTGRRVALILASIAPPARRRPWTRICAEHLRRVMRMERPPPPPQRGIRRRLLFHRGARGRRRERMRFAQYKCTCFALACISSISFAPRIPASRAMHGLDAKPTLGGDDEPDEPTDDLVHLLGGDAAEVHDSIVDHDPPAGGRGEGGEGERDASGRENGRGWKGCPECPEGCRPDWWARWTKRSARTSHGDRSPRGAAVPESHSRAAEAKHKHEAQRGEDERVHALELDEVVARVPELLHVLHEGDPRDGDDDAQRPGPRSFPSRSRRMNVMVVQFR